MVRATQWAEDWFELVVASCSGSWTKELKARCEARAVETVPLLTWIHQHIARVHETWQTVGASRNKQAESSVARGAGLHDYRMYYVCDHRRAEGRGGMKVDAAPRQECSSAADEREMSWVVGHIQGAASAGVEVAFEIVWRGEASDGNPKSSEIRHWMCSLVVHMEQVVGAGGGVVVGAAAFLEQG